MLPYYEIVPLNTAAARIVAGLTRMGRRDHAIKLASDRHHEYATLEHLLLALMDDTDASQVMKACNVEMDALRKSVQKYIDEDLSTLVLDDSEEAKPTTGFQRVKAHVAARLQRRHRDTRLGNLERHRRRRFVQQSPEPVQHSHLSPR
jgi:ATP-dependent Clp protease ATP-binding subunit ClpA